MINYIEKMNIVRENKKQNQNQKKYCVYNQKKTVHFCFVLFLFILFYQLYKN